MAYERPFDREIVGAELNRIRSQVATISSDGYQLLRASFAGDKPVAFYYGMLAGYNHCNSIAAVHVKRAPDDDEVRMLFLAVGSCAAFVADLIASRPPTPRDQLPVRVPCIFLGHGRSDLWAKVVSDVLVPHGLSHVEFNSDTAVSRTAVARLEEMLARATFAVIVVTAEDDSGDGGRRARQNVIHEIGFFQGALGFERVALLVQDGVEWLSNLEGLQQIRFAGDRIEAAWFELQRVLKREGQLP